MSLVSLVITLIVIGVLLWLVNQLPIIDAKILRIINIVVVIAVVIWLLTVFLGGVGRVNDIKVPTYHGGR